MCFQEIKCTCLCGACGAVDYNTSNSKCFYLIIAKQKCPNNISDNWINLVISKCYTNIPKFGTNIAFS